MKLISIKPSSFFKVLHSTERSQVAEMVLVPGQSTGGPTNSHSRSDQWLYVVEGEGSATINGKMIRFYQGDLLLIEAGETHEIKNIGNNDLKTFNIYAPVEY